MAEGVRTGTAASISDTNKLLSHAARTERPNKPAIKRNNLKVIYSKFSELSTP